MLKYFKFLTFIIIILKVLVLCLWLFYVSRYRRLKMQIFFSLTNLANYLFNIIHFYDHKNVRELFYQNILSPCYYYPRLAPLLKFWNEKIKKVVVGIFTHHWKKSKMEPLNLKSENRSTSRKFYFDLGPKRYLGSKRSYYWKYELCGRGV